MSKAQALHKLMIVIGLLLILLVTLQSHAAPVHHKMQVEIIPGLKMLKAQDTLTFAKDTPRKLSFVLHKDLQVSVTSSDDSLILLHPATKEEPYAEYGLQLSNQDNKVSLYYQGVIYDPVVNDNSDGLIAPEGATLFGSTYWYPSFLDTQKSFDISVKTPVAWRSLVQGQITSMEVDASSRTSRFVEIYPQEEIYLVAGPFSFYEKELKDGKKVQVLLRKDDSSLAQNFISLIPGFLEHYSSAISPYPYSSFTVVENFWETGYGMPSFTLLGPTVIRLPFLLNSSLPHEVLHNWWGNSVYVDYDKGNWCEGLTTYMADHWQQELAGNDRGYRLNTLINYADFVAANPKNDFPVRQFRGRHNSSSQAVGYGKTMMIFHMLEFRFGKDLFKKALQDFYSENLFQRVSFFEIQKSFEKVTNQNLNTFFTQWLDREGAPQIELPDVKVMRWLDGSYSTTYVLAQTQNAPSYELNIPVIWTLENGQEVRQLARLFDKSQVFSLVSHSRPVKVAVDPDYHVFRKLFIEERPATLSSILGSPEVHFYFDPAQPQAEKFARVWAAATDGQDSFNKVTETLSLAPQGALVLIGDKDLFAQFVKTQLSEQKFELTDTTLRIDTQEFNLQETSTVLVMRLKSNPQQPVVWVRWSKENNPEEWASRLTHYGTFGVLVFKGRPAVFKSTWPVLQSPLQRNL
ncbi:MAG: aminopeptidase [Bdellovibrio sp. ArHS]|uniref:M1 family metallopeptidase n=1 Tax=Bdellovibrio sp. ArHS TaxID=1569284 RepID=UPI000583EE61|nr:M1 family aminopeptidase [Bdellovibrio sp. ArHS]KHD87801.1 MAG: aminopeptidase [Bdellovibrio sp. ArHS]